MEDLEMIDKNFWLNKRVLVTGCTGFKGSWLSLWLLQMGAKVYGYALNAPTSPSLFHVLELDKKIIYCCGDIRNYSQFKDFVDLAQPEIVLHLAAQPLVRYSYDHPIETYHTNVLGLVNVLEAIRHNQNVKAIVNVTTDKCYENKEWPWGYRENEPMGGHDPYSNSKGCAELVTSCYQNSYFNTKDYLVKHHTLLASARAGNVIGGGDWAIDRLIPDMIKSFIENKPVIIRNPQAIRPWQHVLEPLSAYLILAQELYAGNQKAAQGWNFGPDDHDAKNVEYIVNHLCKLWGNNRTWQLDNMINPHEAQYLKLDCSKAKETLHWYPRWSLNIALDKIIEWYKGYLEQKDMYQLTINQISEYTKLA